MHFIIKVNRFSYIVRDMFTTNKRVIYVDMYTVLGLGNENLA